MKVILRDDVAKLGTAGEAVNVKNGFARNFLVPRKLYNPSRAKITIRAGIIW